MVPFRPPCSRLISPAHNRTKKTYSSCNPHPLLLPHIQHEGPQSLRAPRLPDDPRVHRNIHHLATLAVQHIECRFQVLQVHVRADEARGHVKFTICRLSAKRLMHFLRLLLLYFVSDDEERKGE
jgi:hypothetical protein